MGVLTSCADGRAEQSRRDEMFAERDATPWTVTETVGDIQFEMEFDRTQYYVGDDVSFTVTVTYHGLEPLVWERTGLFHPNELIDGNVWIGGQKAAYVMHGNILRIDTTQTYELTNATVLTRTGRFCSAEFAELLADGSPVIFRFSLDENISCSVPVVFSHDVPQDEELFSYLQNGAIDQPLYDRARVMRDDENIVVFSSEQNPPQIGLYLPDDETAPQWQSQFGISFTVLTREQLLTVLSNNYPGVLRYDRQKYEDVLKYYRIGG